MDSKKGFGIALRKIRKAKNFTQEDFEDSSSRTYLSTLERGLKSPTLAKVEDLASALKVHPLTILLSAYAEIEDRGYEVIIKDVMNQLREIEEE